MTGRQYRSIVFWSVILLLSMVTGFILLAMVAKVPGWVIVIVALLVLLVAVFLLRTLARLSSLVREEAERKEGERRDETPR